MKQLLIYDDNCPLCTWYTGLFVRMRLISADERAPFSHFEAETTIVDIHRAQNEIALLDGEANAVYYGIDSLLHILGKRSHFINRIGKSPVTYWFLKKLYFLISYNRKVIVAKKCGPGNVDCVPNFNYFYRFAFMLICLTFNTLMLSVLHSHLFTTLPYYHLNYWELQAAHFSLVACNCTLSLTMHPRKRFEYLGQVNMLALQVVLLLVPVMLLNIVFHSIYLSTFAMCIVALIIFHEYVRRMDYTNMLHRDKWIVTLNIGSLIAFIIILFEI